MQERTNKALNASERQRLLVLAKAGNAKRTQDTRPAIVRVEREQSLAPSFGQQRLLFLEQMEGMRDAYHVSSGICFQGVINRTALGQALDRIVARHESLRTTFVARNGMFSQRISTPEVGRFELLDHDLRVHADPEGEHLRLATLESKSPFNLEQGPLLRGRLIRLGDDRYSLLITMHHVVSDGWSMGIFLGELSTLYAAFCAQAADPLPEPVLQYVDYAAWQRHQAFGDHVRKQADYWKAILAGAPELLELPTDRARPVRQDFSGAFIPFELDATLSQRLKALGRKHGTTLFMTLLAAWGTLLGRLSGQNDLVIGTPTANRGRAEIEGMIGFFVNTLALRLDVSGSPSVAELLHRVRVQALGAQDHQDIPFEQVVELVRPRRNLAHSPIFQVMFAWQNATEGSLQLQGLTQIPSMEAPRTTAKFDLCLMLGETGETIDGGLEFATALFDRTTLQRYIGYFRNLLEAMVDDDQQPIDRLPLLSDSERDQVLLNWNDTGRPFAKESCIHEIFEGHAARSPEATALSFEGKSICYGELNARANRLAHHLRELGVGPDTCVAICVERSLEMMVGLVAILKAGGAYLPIAADLPAERIAFLLNDARPVTVLTQASLVELLSGLSEARILDLAHSALWADLPSHDVDCHALGLTSRHLAYVSYTSGSTGTPKGVMVEHRSVLRLVHNTDFADLGGQQKFLSYAPLAFDASTFEIWGALLNGHTLLLAPPHKQSLDDIGSLIRREHVTTAWLTAGLFHLMVDHQLPALGGLRQLLAGGDVLSPEHVRRFVAAHPGVHLINGYGPTENTTFTCCFHVPSVVPEGSLPIGRPIANTQVYILDTHGQPVPPGVVGEINIGGVGLARGYLNRPELTAEKFLPDRFSREPDARMYRSGDLGRWLPNGTIAFVGRNDFQVKIRGFRIELGEIESALAAHASVREAIVLAREDAPGDRRLVAYYTADEALGAQDLRTHLAARLPDYMLPTAYEHLDALPLTANGKVDRKALPAPDTQPMGLLEFEAPQGAIEVLLADIWADLLKLDRVGRRDNFFELGGHSLLTVQFLSRLRKCRGLEVQLGDLFDHPVLADFARILDGAERTELPSITPAPAAERHALSFAQQRLWFLAQLEGASAAYHMPMGWRLMGDLDRHALRQALDRIVARHETLRTTFAEVDGTPIQDIAPAAPFQLAEHDLRAHADPHAECLRQSAEEAAAPFDLEHGPLVRGRLLQLAENEHMLLITKHHIVSDGWSMGVFAKELSALYVACQNGSTNPLRPLEVQYADFAAWQRRWLKGDLLQRQAAYWRSTLTGAPELLELHTDHPRPSQQDYTGASIDFALDQDLTEGLRSLSQRHGTTLFMTLLAAWAALLSRLSGQQDLIIGTPTANRGRVELEGLIGFFANTLALRLDLSGSPTTAQLLERVKAQALDAQHNQDIPFEQVVEIAQPTRSMAHSPLFQVMFSWQEAGQDSLVLPGLALESLGLNGHVTSQFDLSMIMWDDGATILGVVEYATALFDKATLERHLSHFQNLLRAMLADPAQAVDRLPLLAAAERSVILETWNDTRAPYPSERCIHELFEDHAAREPEAVALVLEAKSLTYGELNARANKLARYLRTLGVGPDVHVAICIERSLEMLVGILAILKAGGAYLPLNPDLPKDRIAFLIEDASPIVVLAGAGLEALFSTAECGLPFLDLSAEITPWSDLPVRNLDRRDVGLRPNDLAYVIYTSGSTGIPKGVMVEHRSLCHQIAALQSRYGIGPGDRLLQFAAFTFDVSVEEIFGALCSGATLILRTDAWLENFWAMSEASGITVANIPTLFWQQLLLDEDFSIPTCIRQIIIGGDAVGFEAMSLWFKREGHRPRLCNAYGPTETTVNATILEATPENPDWQSIGSPIANTRIYILDAYGQPVPVGVAGEIYIGGAGVARGYLSRPELTVEKFLPDPFSTDASARMYRSGDLGRWRADGTISFLGRNDFQVKIRGFRIELGEIEAVLTTHPAVREAVVMAREDKPGDKRLVGYITSVSGGNAATGAELKAHLSTTLPDHMIPAAYVFLDALPLAISGKLDRKALPAPEAQAFTTQTYAPPQGEIETTLAAIWSDVLKLDRVGRHDNFFDLGGHSLLTVQVLSRLRVALGLELRLGDFFVHPVLADFARILDAADHADLPNIAPADPAERATLSFAQQRLWFVTQMDGASAAYHIPLGLRLTGELDRHALRRALDGIVARHEALRTSFTSVQGNPVQRIAESACFLLIEHDLRLHADPEVELSSLARQEAQAPFDLQHGPLIRGRLVQLAGTEHALMITMHHIVSDGWSIGIFTRELSSLYTAFRNGQEDPLPALEVQYPDYAASQRRWLQGELLQSQASYWKTALSGASELLELPTDRPRPPCQDFAGACVVFALEPDLTVGLKALSQRHGTTLFMTLLTAWAALLSRLSGQQDIVIGTPAANRGRTEIEGLIGFFVNTLPLRLDLSESPTVAELLKQAKTRALAAQDHQDIPFEQVVELAQPTRSMAHSPLFQVMFAWQNGGEQDLDLPGMIVAPLDIGEHVTAKFDLSLALWEDGGSIAGGMEYATALFDKATVETHIDLFRNLLRSLVADEMQTVDRLAILGAAERAQVLDFWNDTGTALPDGSCLHELFEAQAARTPGALACAIEEHSLSYAELDARANQLAHHLIELGVGHESRVAILQERSIGLIVSILAVLKAGGTYVPLHNAHPLSRLRLVVEQSEASVMLSDRSLCGSDWPEDVHRVDVRSTEAWQSEPVTAPASASHPEFLAYIMFTSGSTGQPKGIAVTHRNVVALALDQRWQDGSQQRVLLHSPQAFDASTYEIWVPLLSGQQIIIAPPGDLDLAALAQVIAHQKVTALFLTTALFGLLAEENPRCFACVQSIWTGGELSSPMAFQKVLVHCPATSVVHVYGPTETTTFATSYPVLSPFGMGSSVPIGAPMDNTRLYILDSALQLVPVGVAGELYIGGTGLARGYFGRPDLTAERFIANPFGAPGSRLYRTGDRVSWLPDGTVDFIGRTDHQIKIRGFRIELGEIQAALIAHPAVRECIVQAREDSPGNKRLVAYYTASDDLAVKDLLAFLGRTLPEYMVPAAYVRLDTLPLNPNGKVDQKRLPAPAGRAFATGTFEPPQGAIEIAMAGVWTELLNIDRIGRHDNFFELGGHSLLVIRVINRLNEMGIALKVADLFSHPTLEAAAFLASSAEIPALADRPIVLRPEGTGCPLFLMHDGSGELAYAHSLAAHLDHGFPVYGLPCHSIAPMGLRTVQAMAARHVDLIRSVQAAGPYRLAGWSLGGFLAYEVTSQLLGRDEQVEFLALLDSHAVGALLPQGNKELLLAHVAPLAVGDESLMLALESLRVRADDMSFDALVLACKEISLLPQAATDHDVQQRLSRLEALMVAVANYHMAPIPVTVHAFDAQDEDDDDSPREWEHNLSTGRLSRTQVPGNHFSMVREPCIQVLGKAFSEAISRVTGEAERHGDSEERDAPCLEEAMADSE